MINKIDHIAIVVDSLEDALIAYQSLLGLEASKIEYVESEHVRVVFIPVGDTKIELVQPMGGQGKLNEFLQKTGGGLHHIALEVESVEQLIQTAGERKINMKDEKARIGANGSKVAFAKRDAFHGAILEFVEPSNKVE